jgi:hypothetical protein
MVTMKVLVPFAIAAVVAATGAPAAAQGGAHTAVRPHAEEPLSAAAGHRPFQVLLRHREQLRLTEAQVSRIEEIGRGLEARNAPLRQQLAAERERWMAARRAQLERMEAGQRHEELRRMRQERRVPEPMQPLVRQMRENIAAAVREAHLVLSDQQRQQARRMLRQEAHARRAAVQARRAGERERRAEPRRPRRAAPRQP